MITKENMAKDRESIQLAENPCFAWATVSSKKQKAGTMIESKMLVFGVLNLKLLEMAKTITQQSKLSRMFGAHLTCHLWKNHLDPHWVKIGFIVKLPLPSATHMDHPLVLPV